MTLNFPVVYYAKNSEVRFERASVCKNSSHQYKVPSSCCLQHEDNIFTRARTTTSVWNN